MRRSGMNWRLVASREASNLRGNPLSNKHGEFIGNSPDFSECAATALRTISAVLFVDCDFQRAQELLILRSQFDLACRFKLTLGRWLRGSSFAFFAVFVRSFFTFVKTNSRFEHEEHVIPRSFNLADRARNPVGVRERLVYCVTELLHQLFQSVVQELPLSNGPLSGYHPPFLMLRRMRKFQSLPRGRVASCLPSAELHRYLKAKMKISSCLCLPENLSARFCRE